MSASTSSRSRTESGSFLVRRHDQRVTAGLEEPPHPSSPETEPRSWPGMKSMLSGLGTVWPSG